MEKSMEILLSRLDEKLQQQTKIITTTVTESVMVAIDERLKTITDENTKLKEKISTLEQKLRGMEFEKRKYNLVFFGIEESGKRSKGRPRKRWVDDIKSIAGDEWMLTAKDRDKWLKLEEAFTLEGLHNSNK
ncbi:hypothetical protein B5X24_HaOG204582 [Helicoverpa armigera]|nr:hypothetical protein B5X24_HaOG204582 [Helicoverpa armigera]